MAQIIISFVSSFPPVLGTLLLAMLPIAERFALPVAIAGFHLRIPEAFFLVVAGNMVPVIVILLLADKFHLWVTTNAGVFGKAWIKSIAHAQKKFARYEKYGLIGLLIFLSVPSPVNGAFSASLIAFFLGYPMHKSLPYLLGGVIIGNLVVLSITVGAGRIF